MWADPATGEMQGRHPSTFWGKAQAVVDGGRELLDSGAVSPSEYLNVIRYMRNSGVPLEAMPTTRSVELMQLNEGTTTSRLNRETVTTNADDSLPPNAPYFNHERQVSSDPVVEVFRGMSQEEFTTSMNERSGGVEYFGSGKKGNAGNLYVTPDLKYTRQLDAKSPPGKYSNYQRFTLDKAAYDALIEKAYVENSVAQNEHPNNKPYVKDEFRYRNKFTLKGETGGVINFGIGEYKVGEFNQIIVKTTLVRNYNVNAAEGASTNGPGYDPTRFAPEGAIRLQTGLNILGKGMTGVALALDANKLYKAYQSGDANRLGETASGVVGGWSGAWAGAKLGAEWGFALGRTTVNPYVIVGATFAGMLVGGGLGYMGGEGLGKHFYNDFLGK